MNFGNRFSSENFLISVCGHLALIAIMVTSFAVVVDRAMTVASDRIEILEIDLDSVRVSGDETTLYNVNADSEPETSDDADVSNQSDNDAASVADPEPEPAPIETEPEQITVPSLVEETPIAPDVPDPVVKTVEDEPKPTQSETEKPKKKKTVIRVNRESVSLNRTLTVSVVDALRVAMTRCWTIDTTRADIGDIRAVAHLTMRRNGTVRDVWFESAARAETDPAFAYVLDTIRSAINVCQPFKMLPENEFDKWEKIQLTFYPTQGKVM
ncbi:MAG TPA: hypothetical protein IAD02_03480 [Candidatus Enterousia intestinigallinarum]|uniref:TolA protein n=1 Tax=Candidatus Enterousia intestinigallinarum TaxID=2840790 RepID=A0A9D1JWZ7_9PROT|nr:hypothetical protein [Candidatus Enterousia intestinigallinarum]